MDSRFKIKLEGCNLFILGLEQEGGEYMYEEVYDASPSFRQFKYSESITLNAIYSISSTDEYTLKSLEVLSHTEGADLMKCTLTKDGLYLVSHIILPTQKFIESLIPGDNLVDMYSTIYYYDEIEEKFKIFDPKTGGITDTSAELILEVNPEGSHTIIRGDQMTFSICKLRECLYGLIKSSLKGNWTSCKKNMLNLDKSNIDLLYMTLYVIQYLIDFEQYFEAQRILEQVLGCSNICETSIKNLGGCGCGNSV